MFVLRSFTCFISSRFFGLEEVGACTDPKKTSRGFFGSKQSCARLAQANRTPSLKAPPLRHQHVLFGRGLPAEIAIAKLPDALPGTLALGNWCGGCQTHGLHSPRVWAMKGGLEALVRGLDMVIAQASADQLCLGDTGVSASKRSG